MVTESNKTLEGEVRGLATSSAPLGNPERTLFWNLPEPFALESGAILPEVRVGYRTWGSLDAAGTNAVLVCHALTGSADADLWWGGLFGPGRTLDPERDFIVCSNALGSCYGTTGPASLRPEDGRPYGSDFPAVTVRDMVHVQGRASTARAPGSASPPFRRTTRRRGSGRGRTSWSTGRTATAPSRSPSPARARGRTSPPRGC